MISLLVGFYKMTLSKFLFVLFGRGCRYQPTCSEYFKAAVERFGLFQGSWLGIKRLLSCHPFSRKKLVDPVPPVIV